MKLKVKKKPVKEEVKEKTVAPKYSNLREVMDYSRPLSIFFSGVENESYLAGCYEVGVTNFLMSYHYLNGKPLHSLISQYKGMKLFIDSGAYTYMNDPKFEDRTITEWEIHIDKYLKWAERNREYIFAIASLDLEFIVGAEQVKEWNRKFFEPFMLRTGIPVCFVWHGEEAYNTWEQHCQRYPYVGLTAVGSEEFKEFGDSYFIDKLKVAEKYNTLVHGMGMTRTASLTNIPFYTVDSTTWNVGMKYGEISVWKDNHMSRIKKKEFETKAFPVIEGYKYPFDLNLIRAEDTMEMLKVNAYAFKLAEEYIHFKLKSLTYWQKAKAVKNDLDNLPPDFFPSLEWLKTNNPPQEEVTEYCRKMNINPEIPEAFCFVQDMTTLLNWDNPDYAEFKSIYEEENGKTLHTLHDIFVNKIRDSLDEIVEDLKQFYKENLEGSRDTLLQYGTNFDRMQKERDEYLEEDEEYEYVDLSQAEVQNRLQGLLPSPKDFEDGAPEIDALDKEIYAKADITPVFDEKGHFVKGQQKVRKPKQVYSKKFPKLACDNCFSAAKCPEYKAGYVCAYSKIFKKFDTRNMVDIIESIQGIVSYNMERMQKAMIFETLNGSLDGNVSALMDTNIRYMQMLQNMYNNASQEVIRQTKVVRADGSMESTMQVSNPQSGGILEKLFSFGTEEKKEPKEEVIDAEAIEQK